MPRTANIELRQLEADLDQVVTLHRERMEMWAGHVAKRVKKYGLPLMYVGHVDLAYNNPYSRYKIIQESKQLPVEQRVDFLRKKSEELSTAFPDILFALFRDKSRIEPDIILANERCIEVDLIASYKIYPIRKELVDKYIHSFMDIKCYAKYSDRTTTTTVYFSSEEDEKEAVAILEYAINGIKFNYPEKVIDSSKIRKDAPDTHPSFFGNSLLRPQKQIAERLAYQGFSDSYYGVTKEIAGTNFRFDFTIGKESQLIYQIWGYSDYIKGYENVRKVFDEIVEILKSDFGPWGLKISDIPQGTRKNSIMKGLRENLFAIKATYTWHHIDLNPSIVSVEIVANEGQEASIHYELIDRINERESGIIHSKALEEAKRRRMEKKKRIRRREE